jgi:hypothetical protein
LPWPRFEPASIERLASGTSLASAPILKARALAAAREELLRAGLHALASLSAAKLVAALNQLEPVKIGRPKQGH